jgi:hypothetical protein
MMLNYETKVFVFWNVNIYSPVKVNISFGGTYNHHLQDRKLNKVRNQQEEGVKHSKQRAISADLKMEEICSSETLVDFYRTIWRYIIKDRTLHTHHYDNSNTTRYKTFQFT